MPESTELVPIDPDGPYAGCSDRERQWVDFYVGAAQWNATEAARLCGYKDPEVSGWRMKQSSAVKNTIRNLTANRVMNAEELLLRLGAEARLDMADFPEIYRDGPDGRRLIDWPKVKELGLGPFIKAVKQTKYGESLELIDTQRAKEMIGRALGLFADRLRVEGQIDYSKLTDDELKQLAAGKRPSTL